MTVDYIPPTAGSKIIIAGGGCFGLSTAYALSLKNQYEIWVFDRQEIPAADAASSGITYINTIDMSVSMYINCIYRYQQDCSHGLRQ
jgi:sarcosine oxidase/L-pipecolate oxidase